MMTFTSIDLQKQTGDVQRAASSEGAIITSHGKPRNIMLSIAEFRRLKKIAGESLPSELENPAPRIMRHTPDPLGYDVSDFRAAATKMADDALSGAHDDAVSAELHSIRQSFSGRP